MSTFEPEYKDPVSIGSSIDKWAKRSGGPTSSQMQVVFAHWTDVVGDVVASHARPLRIASGVLYIGVDQPAWATQLQFLAAEILSKLSGLLGADTPQSLEIRVRPTGASPGR